MSRLMTCAMHLQATGLFINVCSCMAIFLHEARPLLHGNIGSSPVQSIPGLALWSTNNGRNWRLNPKLVGILCIFICPRCLQWHTYQRSTIWR